MLVLATIVRSNNLPLSSVAFLDLFRADCLGWEQQGLGSGCKVREAFRLGILVSLGPLCRVERGWPLVPWETFIGHFQRPY